MCNKKTTPTGQNYWFKTGVYQAEYDLLQAEFLPDTGDAVTLAGQMLLRISKLVWDFGNNGGGTFVEYDTWYEDENCFNCDGDGTTECYDMDEDDYNIETCPDCDGVGYEQVERTGGIQFIRFEDYIDFLCEYFESARTLKKFMLTDEFFDFNDKSNDIINAVMDDVIYYILNNPQSQVA